MGTLSFFPLHVSSLLRHHHCSSKTHLVNLVFSPKISSIKLTPKDFCNQITVARCNRNDLNESRFVDENGVVEDMDGYMNYLSLEYDSVWDTKPSWCQPWTIMFTGLLVITFSWLILHSLPVTIVVLSLICVWWYLFLYAYPKLRSVI
ncbi:PREDICTED: uncharacterized protein LOC104596513 isoform X2 [Nelumbo nucifera]|uniref:Uncharacterized protein LOC104596513 isoform X2 n=1 Tax=Nelumbo nucifera TaxID=4432 RepID=A0A1U8Q2V9_NELNU|nr:PREDICTED: uncharacterized protein LOC104596513 isoform X2 [Nelumbo nucifera]